MCLLERAENFIACPRPQTSMRGALNAGLSGATMTSSKERAAEFRRRAAACLEVAERMSLTEDKTQQMVQVAERLLELARRVEEETKEPESK
jgi:hypothetical protein